MNVMQEFIDRADSEYDNTIGGICKEENRWKSFLEPTNHQLWIDSPIEYEDEESEDDESEDEESEDDEEFVDEMNTRIDALIEKASSNMAKAELIKELESEDEESEDEDE